MNTLNICLGTHATWARKCLSCNKLVDTSCFLICTQTWWRHTIICMQVIGLKWSEGIGGFKNKWRRLMKGLTMPNPSLTTYFVMLPYLQMFYKGRKWIWLLRSLGNKWEIKRTLDGMETFRVFKSGGTILDRFRICRFIEFGGERQKGKKKLFLEKNISFWNVEFYFWIFGFPLLENLIFFL